MTEPTFKELRATAKARGINTFHMKREDIAAALGALPMGVFPEGASETFYSDQTDSRSDQTDSHDARPVSREEPPRRQRVPLGTAQQKLNFPAREGYHRHLFNDRGNRLYDAQRAGYEFVEELDDGRQVKVSRRVGTHEDGSPMIGYLMEIRQEFYDEDQKTKQKVNDAIDDEIMRRNAPEGTGTEDRDRFYTPSDGRTMSVET